LLDTAAEVPSGMFLSVDEIDDDRRDTLGRLSPIRLRQVLHPRPFCLKSPLKGMQTFSVIAEPSVSNMLIYFVTPSPHFLPN
jgi:hypothetical protein